MSENIGKIIGVNGNLLKVEFNKPVIQNEVAYACVGSGNLKLKAEVIRVRGNSAELQVFEDTVGLKVGDPVEFTGELLSVELGPGLLTQVFDGLQNPLPALAEECGFFLQRGQYLDPLPRNDKWAYTPTAKVGDTVIAGDTLGTVPEGQFQHRIMTPFNLRGKWTVDSVKEAGEYTVEEVIATLKDDKGNSRECKIMQTWPVKMPIKCYAERLRPTESMATKQRIVDTFFPVAKGGTYCIPRPVRCRQNRSAAGYFPSCRSGRGNHCSLRRARRRSGGNTPRIPRTHRSPDRQVADGTHADHLQHLVHACGRP